MQLVTSLDLIHHRQKKLLRDFDSLMGVLMSKLSTLPFGKRINLFFYLIMGWEQYLPSDISI